LFTTSRLKYLYLAYFSKPVADRVLYRAIQKHGFRSILEIGLGSTERSLRMIRLAQRRAGSEPVRFIAIDMFEARPAETRGLSLKEAHKLLKATGAHVQLIPGDPSSALARSANALGPLDLVIVSGDCNEASLSGAWFYMPRILHAASHLYIESPGARDQGRPLRPMAASEVEQRAAVPRRRAA